MSDKPIITEQMRRALKPVSTYEVDVLGSQEFNGGIIVWYRVDKDEQAIDRDPEFRCAFIPGGTWEPKSSMICQAPK